MAAKVLSSIDINSISVDSLNSYGGLVVASSTDGASALFAASSALHTLTFETGAAAASHASLYSISASASSSDTEMSADSKAAVAVPRVKTAYLVSTLFLTIFVLGSL